MPNPPGAPIPVSPTPVPPVAAPPKFNLDEIMLLATDLPALEQLVVAAVNLAAAEKQPGLTLLQHVKLAEPVMEAASSLGDTLITQLGKKS